MDSTMQKLSLTADLKETGHRAFAGAVAGFLCGGLIGGVGGRLAMFLLRVTSGPTVMGVESDDGFVIGSFTSSTGFLVLFTAALGLVGGLIYTGARGWLHDRFRPHITAGLFALVGGALIVHPQGVDFTLIKPQSLAIGLFVLLPGLYGYYVAKVVDRLLDRPVGRFAPWMGIVLVLVPVVFMGTGANGLGGILVALLVVGWLVGRRIRFLRGLPSSVWVTWLGTAVLGLIGGASAVFLVQDVLEIL
ncbi:MAG: hypothetical protein M3454_09065 [Actinomycetota bacterium]|nr:hypothetical protein [Actinomycetota bacterium]